MPYHQNSRGQIFNTGPWGTYRVNDGNPENDDPDFDPEEFERREGERIDYLISRMDEY